MLPDFPSWMLWTAVGLTALAVALLLWNWFATRSAAPDPTPLTIQPLAATAPEAAAPPRPVVPPHFPPPPAPLTAVPAADSPERRNAYRRVGNAVLVLAQEVPARGKPRNAWVVDRSRQGLRVTWDSELPAGTTLQVRVATAPDSLPWVTVEVRNCAAAEGHWELGCRFVEPPAWNVLLLFG
jgi:hypothetical protein